VSEPERLDQLVETLRRARQRGLLGPGDPAEHVEHAWGLASAVEARLAVPAQLLDLGSGSGLPGLVLALRWPTTRLVLLDAGHRSAEHLREAMTALGLETRLRVHEGRAEPAAHDSDLRERFDLVVARAFGRPAVAAEIGGAFARVGGFLVVTEPPLPDPDRWPRARLAELGLGPPDWLDGPGVHAVLLEKMVASPVEVPRRTGMPAKRPRW
jgi:16S rRNA (guanine527-N7)-methyltransferase